MGLLQQLRVRSKIWLAITLLWLLIPVDGLSDSTNYALVCANILNPVTGQLCTDTTIGPEWYNGSSWLPMDIGGVAITASLPTCNSSIIYREWIATDALTPAALGILVGGGAIKVKVYCNGSNWIVE